ncbi:MAG: hypothetical protein MZW92_32015 [Comamonadaceae bacterium]|nr:hypothetical protein [Comamonadaceae bacterium]
MNHTILRAALDARNPESIANYLACYRNREEQARALLEIFYDCTAGEVKRIHAWASDWLSESGHQALRARGDVRWQAVKTVYTLAAQAIREAGLGRSAEVQP